MPDHNDASLHEVEVNQGALINILSRYPGTFDVLRELIQNADDAEAPIVEVHLQTGRVQKSQPVGEFDDIAALNVHKWIIRNKGSFKERDWERLGRIAAGNDDCTKVGAFGVGFYSVLSKSDRPLIRSSGKLLQFCRGKDGKLFKHFTECLPDGWTSVELELRVPEPLPILPDLAKFLVSSVAFLTNVHTISVHLDDKQLLNIHKELYKSPVVISISPHLVRTTPSQTLTIESVQHAVQKITIDGAEWAFTSTSLPVDTADTFIERLGCSVYDYSAPTSSSEIILRENVIMHDLYTAVIRVDLLPDSKMKRGVESSMKSLPSSFKCKAIYFNHKQYSELPQAKHLACLFSDSRGIVPGNSGRFFIGQSTNQTTGIGLHISAHFLPTIERGSIDLANGEVAAWNREVLWVSGFLARVIYEEEMRIAARSEGELATQLGLRTMACFAFDSTSPHSGVSQDLQDAFFSCFHRHKSPLPVVSDTGISCVSDSQFRQSNEDLSFLKRYRFLHRDVEPRQHSEITKRYKIPPFKYQDIVHEFETGVTQDVMQSFLVWWEDTKKNFSSPQAETGKKFCKQLASRGVLRSSNGVEISLKNVRYYAFFALPDDLSPPDNIHIDVASGAPTRHTIECFGWTHLPLLVWLKYACSQARQLALNNESNVGLRILRCLVRFALVEDEETQWDEVANLMEDIRCIPTNMGLKLPADSYFVEADICRNLSVAKEADLLDIPGIYVAGARDFHFTTVSLKHVRKLLAMLHVRPAMEWKDMVESLEIAASEESNERLLQFLVDYRDRLMVQHINDLKEKKVFCSMNHGRVSATDLYFPDEGIRKLGLPILALPRDSIISQHLSGIHISGSFPIEPFLESLGIQRYPSLNKIIELAALNQLDIRRSALQYLLSNLESRYAAYKPDDFVNIPFIPTKCGSLACTNEAFASPVWEKLGFKQASEPLHRDLSRLGVRDDPSVDMIIEHLKNREHTLPDLDTAAIWFEHLSLHGKLPIQTLREQFSTIPFVPAKGPGNSTSDPSRIEYFPPKECFISSTGMKEHYRNIFPFVDFGQNGNSFLESCCAKKSPDASDFARKMVQDPQEYLKALGNDTNLYLEDLRTIASRLDSISEDDKKAMQGAPMFLAFRQGMNGGKLLPAHQVVIRDWEARDFGANVFLAPEDDVVEKMYHKMGSEFLGKYVQYDITHTGTGGNYEPPFNRDRVVRCIRCFMRQRDKSEKTEVSFYDEGSTDSFRVMTCKTLSMKKTFVPPSGVLTDGMESRKTDYVQVKAGFELGESSTLWVIKGSSESVDLRNDVAVALCRILLKTFGPNDVLLLASLLAMGDESLDSYYGREMKSVLPSAPPAKVIVRPKKPTIEFSVPLHLARVVGLVGVRLSNSRLPSRKTISLEDDMQKAIALSRGSDLDTPDFSVPCQRQPTESKKPDSQCKAAHRIRLNEKKNLRDEETQMKFFLAETARCKQPPQACLREFAKLISDLAHVFGLEVSRACYIFWNDTDEDLMAFNRDQRYIFFNLAHYYKFFYNKGVGEKRAVEEREVVTEWFLIMAHEIAHNVTMDHDEYHGSLSSRIAVTYLPDLHKRFRCFAKVV